jgi:hypothetical protein
LGKEASIRCLCKELPYVPGAGVKYNEQNKHQLLHGIASILITLIYKNVGKMILLAR